MAEQKNEIAKTFSETLTDKLVSVENALPKNFNKERFVQNALAVINEKPELARVNKAQLLQGLMRGAFLGLDFYNRECYLIQYGNSIQFQTDYKGDRKFVKKYSMRPILDTYAKVVREGDVFVEKIIDGKATIDFTPKPFNNSEIMGAFAVCLYKDGGLQYEVMTTEEIQEVRNVYSKAANSKAWKNSFGEMCKKTVYRRLCKSIDCDYESTEAKAAWEEGSDSNFNTVTRERNEEVVDVFSSAEPVDVIDTTATEVSDEQLDKECEEIFK